MAHFMLLRRSPEPELINQVDHFPHIIAALDLVLQFAENFPNFILNRIRVFGIGLELTQIGKELAVHEISQIIPGKGFMVIWLIS